MRYYKFNYLIKNFILSKTLIYSQKYLPQLIQVELNVGHYKVTNLFMEHGLIFLNLTGQLPISIIFQHGKKLKRTVVLKSIFNKKKIYRFIDKFISLVLPLLGDLHTIKFHKLSTKNNQYLWRIYKFFEYDDINIFWTDRVLKKNVFFPLNFSFSFKNNTEYNEHLIRILRLPFIFYKNTAPKALDDLLKLKNKKHV